MKRLYAPWRHDYVTKASDDNNKKGMARDKSECAFCKQFQAGDDDKYFIIKRFELCAAMMNFYPYNSGHIMILPFEHVGELFQLKSETRNEMMEVVSLSTQVLTDVLRCEGFNIGINLGIAGGGGIPSHVHIHVLPRWRGDTNFLETLGQTKLVSADLFKTFANLKEGFAKISKI